MEKKAIEASAITIVESHPITNIGRVSVSRPIIRGFMAITIITAIRGAARRPFTMALQYSAFTGSSNVKFSATPPKVASAIVA
jgi:hypothetical protein